MEFRDVILLLHPVITVVVVFPLIGIVVNRALQTRQRRLQTAAAGKSKIPASAGQEHVQLGRWLTGSVVGIVLLALANDIFGHILDQKIWQQDSFKVILIGLLFGVAIAALALLYRAQEQLWRGVFATLAGMSLVVLGCQDGIYRKTDQWYFSHYYYGMTAALLMIFSLAILREIYQDRTHRWRNVHIILNTIALLIFIGQGFTGAQSLLEVPLAWQEPYVNKLYEQQCDKQACTVQAAPQSVPAPKTAP
jgi:MFS family permease